MGGTVIENEFVSETETGMETVIEIVIEIEYVKGTGTVNVNEKEMGSVEIVIESLKRIEVDTALEVVVVSDHLKGEVVVAVGTVLGEEVGVGRRRVDMRGKLTRGRPKRDTQKKGMELLKVVTLKTRMAMVIPQMGPTMRRQ